MSDNKYSARIKEFSEFPTAKGMIFDALKELAPRKGAIFAFNISFLLAIPFSILIGPVEDTVTIMLSVVHILLNILMAIFACIFAVYSILLAFLSDSYIKKLIDIDSENNVSYLKSSTSYFESVLFLYFLAICITGLTLIFLTSINPFFTLTSNHLFNNITAMVMLLLYFTFIFRVIYEVKSTIYNTIILFRASIAFKIISIANEENEEKENDEIK